MYKSSNGTSLGTSSATYSYGTTNTISAPAKTGYQTPSSQTVKWDSTSKTITFTYTPSSVSNSAISGVFVNYSANSQPEISYSATISYRNRTATSVEVQITTTVKNGTSGWYGYSYGVAFRATCGSVNSGQVQVASLNGISGGGYSCTASTGWMTIPLNTTDATSLSFSVNMFNTNWENNYVNYPGYNNKTYTWTVNIPAY